MGKHIEPIAFALVAIGTLGLLANEFLFTWGRSATLTFAAMDAIGLVALGIALRRRGRHNAT
jgi:hypothetical protein